MGELVVSKEWEYPSTSRDSSLWQTLISEGTHSVFDPHIKHWLTSTTFTIIYKIRNLWVIQWFQKQEGDGLGQTDRHHLCICVFKCQLVSHGPCHAHYQDPSANTRSPLPGPFRRSSKNIGMTFACMWITPTTPLAAMMNVCHTEEKKIYKTSHDILIGEKKMDELTVCKNQL